MNIVVTVKVVPEEIKIDELSGKIMREGKKSMFNQLDMVALEEALKLKKSLKASLTVFSMAPLSEERLLNSLFGYGVDRVVLISDPLFSGSDALATAIILREAIVKIDGNYDLIIQGDYSADGSTGILGGELAALLGITYLSHAMSLEYLAGTLAVKRYTSSIETFSVKLPALISMRSGANSGAILNLFALSRTKDKKVEIYSNGELCVDPMSVGTLGSKTESSLIKKRSETLNRELIKNGGYRKIVEYLKNTR